MNLDRRRKGPYKAREAEPLGLPSRGVTSTNNAQHFLMFSLMTMFFDFLKEISLKNVWLFLRVTKPLKEWPQCKESLKNVTADERPNTSLAESD